MKRNIRDMACVRSGEEGGTGTDPVQIDGSRRGGRIRREGCYVDPAMMRDLVDGIPDNAVLVASVAPVGKRYREKAKRRARRRSILKRDPGWRRVDGFDGLGYRLLEIVLEVDDKELESMKAEGGTETRGGGEEGGLVGAGERVRISSSLTGASGFLHSRAKGGTRPFIYSR